MNKIKTLILSSIFATTVMGQTARGQTMLPGKPELKTDLNEGSVKFNMEGLKGKIPVIYFGTAYNTPSCESFFATQGLAVRLLKDGCPDIGNDIVPIFICPKLPSDKNTNNIRLAERFGFTVIQGTYADVKKLAKQYNAQYFDTNNDGIPENHTGFMYVQSVDGKNIAIIHGKNPSVASAMNISKALKKEQYEPALNCGY